MHIRFVASLLLPVATTAAAATFPHAATLSQGSSGPRHSPPAAGQLRLLEHAFQQVAERSGGMMGIEVRHLESGVSAGLNRHSRFAMMSVFKLPIALAVLNQVDTGAIGLDRPVRLSSADVRPGVSPLAALIGRAGTTRTIGQLLELMIVDSDNSACDRLLGIVGGPAAVENRVRVLGIDGISVDRSELDMWKDYVGLRTLGSPRRWSLRYFEERAAEIPADARRRAATAFSRDPRNTATPAAMTRLEQLLIGGKALSPGSTAYLLGLLERTRPAAGRIKGLLPSGTPVAHRPGTSGSFEELTAATNDVGIITLPNGRGHLIIAIFLKNSSRPLEARELSIAQVARLAYDAWATPLRIQADDRPPVTGRYGEPAQRSSRVWPGPVDGHGAPEPFGQQEG